MLTSSAAYRRPRRCWAVASAVRYARAARSNTQSRSLAHGTLLVARTQAYVVVSPTFYPNTTDVRFQLGLEACRRAKSLGVPLLLVDASPPEVRSALEEAGAIVHVQTAKGRKGAALRECISLARAVLPADGVVCFQELEKVEMVGLQRECANHLQRTGCDVCVPIAALCRAVLPYTSTAHRSTPASMSMWQISIWG